MTRIVFLGTPQAAVPTLAALLRYLDVHLVVTQPDRPKGRSRRPTPPHVALYAQQAGLAATQPATSAELAVALDGAAPFDVGVVVAYGRILRPEVLSVPRLGFLNIHFSLLPRWRGAAPVARALIEGDTMSGVTIIRIDEGLDTGPVLTAQAVDVLADENAGSLTGRLANLGAELLAATLPSYLEGSLVPVTQVDDGATYAPKLTAEDRPLDIEGNPTKFVNKVRGLAPAPGATLGIDGAPHKILAARAHPTGPPPGTWVSDAGLPVVGIGGGGVEVVEIQPPGRGVMSGADWLRGKRVTAGRVA